MIFALIIAAVFASQSFRGIANTDTVTGEYINTKEIRITHTGDTATAVPSNKLGYGKVDSSNAVTFKKNNTVNLVYTTTAPLTAYVDFAYLEFLKSDTRELIIAKTDNTFIEKGTFTPKIAAESVTLGAYDGNDGFVEIEENTAHTNGKLFYYNDETNSAQLTYDDKKFSGKIDLSKMVLTGSSVDLGYVSATDADGKPASSGIIRAQKKVETPEPTYSINDNGKVEFTTTPAGSAYQGFNKNLEKLGGKIDVVAGNEKKEIDTTDEYHFWYAKYEAGTLSNIARVDLEKAPDVNLEFVVQEDESKPPKLQIVRGQDFTGNALNLIVPDSAVETITLNAEGKFPEYDWIKFKKSGDKKGSIYVADSGKPASVTKVIPEASITFTIVSQDDKKGKVKFTVQPGLIKGAPTHRCIYNEDDNKIVDGSVKCEPLKWVKGKPSEQTFEYSTLSKEGKSYVVITSSNDVTKVKTDNLWGRFEIPVTEPPVDPSAGAFSAVATIFAALVSLLVFAF